MKLCKGAVLALAVSYGLIYCHTNKSKFMLEQKGDSLTLIHITNPTNYILLPIEEEAEESWVRLDIGDVADTDMDIRLAQTKVDYWVPFVLPADAKTVTVRVQKSLGDALCTRISSILRSFPASHNSSLAISAFFAVQGVTATEIIFSGSICFLWAKYVLITAPCIPIGLFAEERCFVLSG